MHVAIAGIPAPRSRPAPDWRGSRCGIRDQQAADDAPRRPIPCRRRPWEHRRAPVPESRCPTWRAPPAPCGRRHVSRPARSPPAPARGQAATAARTVCGQPRHRRHHDVQGAVTLGDNADRGAEQPAMRRISPLRLPGSTSSSGGSASRRRGLLGIGAQLADAARSADGRHRCRAGRQAVSTPPARTAAAPARDRHRRAWLLARPGRQAQTDRADIVDDRDFRRARAHARARRDG